MRVLVVHGSTRGGTEGLARLVADALVAHGVTADIGAAAAVDDLEPYDAVVVGGALYHDRWHHDAARFVDHHLGELQTKQVWFFSSGPLDDSARSGALAPVPQVRELGRRVDIRGHMTFGGVLDHQPGGFLGSLLAWGKPGDFRDPEHVAEWVARIVVQLAMPPTPVTAPTVDERRTDDAARSGNSSGMATPSGTAKTSATATPSATGQTGDAVHISRAGSTGESGGGGGILRRLASAGTAGEAEEDEDLGLDVLSD